MGTEGAFLAARSSARACLIEAVVFAAWRLLRFSLSRIASMSAGMENLLSLGVLVLVVSVGAGLGSLLVLSRGVSDGVVEEALCSGEDVGFEEELYLGNWRRVIVVAGTAVVGGRRSIIGLEAGRRHRARVRISIVL